MQKKKPMTANEKSPEFTRNESHLPKPSCSLGHTRYSPLGA
jgi:hypothetical protein